MNSSAACRRAGRPRAGRMTPAIEVRNLRRTFRVRGGLFGQDKRGRRGGRRLLRPADRRRARRGRRIRLRQVDAGARHPRPAAADRRRGAGRGPAPVPPRPPRARPPDPAGLPGPLRLAQPAPAHPRHRGDAAGRPRAASRSARSPTGWRDADRVGLPPSRAAAIRRSFRAASGSAWRSPGRWCCGRASSSATSRPARSMSPSRRRS